MSAQSITRRLTQADLAKLYSSGEKVSMFTCYDASFARLLDGAGVDSLLIGDSLGNVIQGHDTTLPVTVAYEVFNDPSYGTVNVDGVLVFNTDADSNPNSNTDANGKSNSNTHANSDTDGDRNSYTNEHANPDGNPDWRAADRRRHSSRRQRCRLAPERDHHYRGHRHRLRRRLATRQRGS